MARSLHDLHDSLDALDGVISLSSVLGDVEETLSRLQDAAWAPDLLPADRESLMDALAALDDHDPAGWRAVHGSPHCFNVLSQGGEARFIDFETVALGPVEWDLAHLEPAVTDSYPGPVDDDLLQTCRLVISAYTAAHCWAGLDAGPDMRWHAEHHLEIVRRSSPR